MNLQKLTKPFLLAAGVRALRTLLQTLLATLTTTVVTTQAVDWKLVGITAITSSVYSFLSAIATGLPEIPESKDEESQ